MGEHEEKQRMKILKSCRMILSSKTANFLNWWDTNSCISFTSRNFWIPREI